MKKHEFASSLNREHQNIEKERVRVKRVVCSELYNCMKNEIEAKVEQKSGLLQTLVVC